MSSSSSKRCFSRLVFNNRSILFQQHVSAQASAAAAAASLTKHQFSRHYAGSPLHLYRNFFKSKLQPKSSTSPSTHSSSSSSYRSYCSSSSSSSSSKNGFVGWYLGMIEARPVLTKSVSSALIYTFADFSSQAITQKSEDSFDLVRTIRMAGYGMLVMGPSLHFWFNFVSKFLPKRDVLTTLKKIFIGQTTYGPIMTTVFFSVNAGLQGESSEEIGARLKRDLLPTFKNGLMYWPICDFVTFKFIPVRLQPLVSNSFAYLWTIYITYMATLEKADTSSISAVDSTS